ncbi:hypothetical protein VB779_15490 [Haloarculaceae archaeon H-GB11]|nr:hypothetical protein [Haloarculaceae archaeon H-GB11]
MTREDEALAERVATTPHEELPAADVEAMTRFVSKVDATLDDDAHAAAERLATFWQAYLDAGVAEAVGGDLPSAATPSERAEQALTHDAVGIDLYQSLTRLYDELDATSDSLTGWAERVLDLTVAHEEHLVDHQR